MKTELTDFDRGAITGLECAIHAMRIQNFESLTREQIIEVLEGMKAKAEQIGRRVVR